MLDAYVYDGLRTPFGRHAGELAGVRPDNLASDLVAEVVARSGFDPADIEDVVLGCTNQAGEDARNIARRVALMAGLPLEVGGVTVNRLCASGLAAIVDAARAAAVGQGALFIAGGVESMSRAPFVLAKAQSAYSRSIEVYDTTIGSRFPNARQVSRYGDHPMPETADILAREVGIGREESDAFAEASQRKYARSKSQGFFAGEVHPVLVPEGRRGEVRKVSDDEHPRPQTTVEKLSRLSPLNAEGIVTAGNASGLNDGAAIVMVGTRAIGDRAGVKPRARLVSAAVAGVEPRVMGMGPVPAVRKVLERTQLALADIDVIEINEAFSCQVLACLKILGIPADDPRVNPNGGAIAIGHPLGASGARLVLTAIRELERTGAKRALVTLCIGVGQGLAAIFERVCDPDFQT